MSKKGTRRRMPSGLTVVETLLALSISAFVMLGIVGVIKTIDTSRSKAMNEMNRLTSESWGGLQIYMDLLHADVFNLLDSNVCEVSGANLAEIKFRESSEFFINNSTASGCDLANPAPSCKREKRISLTGSPDDRIVITIVKKVIGGGANGEINAGTRTLRPSILFDQTDPGANDFRTSGNLSFDAQGRLKATLKAYGMARPGMLLRLLSPFETRAIASGGNGYDYDVAPRFPSLHMKVDTGGNIVAADVPGLECQPRWGFLSASGANELVNSAAPNLPSNNLIEGYFRLLNPDAGLNAWVKVSVIELISYTLTEVTGIGGKKRGHLMRHRWDAATETWGDDRMLMEGVKSFALQRANIRTPSISYDVERQTR